MCISLMLNTVYFQDLDRLQEAETSNPIIGTNRSSTRIRSVDTFRGYLFFSYKIMQNANLFNILNIKVLN